MQFLYLRDPLFLVCLILYFVNRWVFKNIYASGFVHDHLNDLICIPFWLPIMLWTQRRVGLRRSDGPPMASEIAICLFVWSWIFEIFLPRANLIGPPVISDHLDILYYSVGALLAAAFWTRWYRPRSARQPGS